MADETVLVCSEIVEGFVPDTVGREGACGRCGKPIWVSASSPPVEHRWCTPCAVAEAATGEPFKVGQFTEAQVADVEGYFRAQRKPQ